MSQLFMFRSLTWTVTDLTRYLRDLFESDGNLQEIWVQGEVSNLAHPSSGHIYFTIKDDSACLKCVMWRSSAARQAYLPREGDAIEVHGNIGIYEVAGQYQLYADQIRPGGEGLLFREFLKLKARLEEEGLFDPARKRPIPIWPTQIGIITSPTGAALRDMIHTLRRRYPLVKVVLAPTAVQGEEAVPGIVAALESLNQCIKPDVILLARGGGSIEDLWAFNDERVARAIIASLAPVITGVGHETDFTIADFAADLRAPTPTAAAELAVPNQADLLQDIAQFSRRLANLMFTNLQLPRQKQEQAQNRLRLASPRSRLRSSRQRLDELQHRALIGFRHALQLRQARLAGLQQRLDALNPSGILERGYALVSHPDGRLVKSVRQVQPGDALRIQVSDGAFNAHADSESES